MRLLAGKILIAVPLWVLIGAAGCAPPDSKPVLPAAPLPLETAQILIESGDMEQAAQLWMEIADDEPENPQAQYQLGLIHSIINPEQAAEYLSRAVQLDPAFDKKAERLLNAIRQASAVKISAYQLTVTGQALSSLEEWALALAALEMAAAEDPNYAESWAYLGEARQHTGQDGALEALQTAISLDPESYAANLFMSIYWQRNSQPKRALPYLQSALKLDPNNLTLQEDLAHTLVKSGLVESGFDTLEALTDQKPERSDVWMMLARLSIENSVQVEEVGLPAARQAVVLAPEDAAATLLLGQAYLLAEDTIMAERFFAKSIQQDPQIPAPHLYLAIIYLNQENQQPAKPHLLAALSLAQDSGEEAIAEQAKQFLQRYFP